MSEHIELSPKELEEIKDDVTFRTKTTIYLKSITERFEKHCDDSTIFRNKVTSLEIHRLLQWFLLSGIIISILCFKFI